MANIALDREEEIRQWFALAKQDLDIAKHLHKTFHPTPDEPICFHCQQSAEKYLKGFLVINNIEPPKTHDLLELLELCEEISADFSEIRLKSSVLSRYGVAPRYPNGYDFTEDDIKLVLKYAEEINAFITQRTNQDFV